MTVELPIEDGEVVLNALDRVLEEQPEAPDASASYRIRQADALLDLCRVKLDGSRSLRGGIAGDNVAQETPAVSATSGTDNYQVVIHVDEGAMTGHPAAGMRSDLPVESVRRLTCDSAIIPVKSDTEGNPISIGRKRRTVSGSLKRALRARDRHCRYPGCTHDRFVHAHHTQHWALGGETGLDNLMLLCSHHHRLVHEGGFHIFVDNNGNHSFRRPDGRAVPACGYRPEDQIDDEVDTSAERLDAPDM
jgi:hypothetical protein